MVVTITHGWRHGRPLRRVLLLLLLLLLVDDARGSRMLQVLRWRGTLLMLVGVVLHREKTH